MGLSRSTNDGLAMADPDMQRAWSKGLGTKSWEQRAGNKELGAKGWEQRAGTNINRLSVLTNDFFLNKIKFNITLTLNDSEYHLLNINFIQ